MPVSSVVRGRLEAQGFCGLDDVTLEEVAPWLRWSPVLCTIFMTSGVALKSPEVLWALVGTALIYNRLFAHP
jgi:hypothetical protein